MRLLIAAALFCALFSSHSEAARLKRHHLAPRDHHSLIHRDGSASKELQRILHNARAETPLVKTALRYVGDGNVTGFSGPWCGAFMALVARKTGAHLPPNPLLAANWRFAGPHVAPQPGAFIVLRHHVGLVLRVVGRFVQVVSGNHSHRVGVGLYPISRAIAFVRPVRI